MYNSSDFSSDSTKKRGHFINISGSVRDYMIFKIFSYKSRKIIYYSNIRPANVPLNKNICLDLLIIPTVIKSKGDFLDDRTVSTILSTVANNDFLNSLTLVSILDMSNLISRTFLIPTNENGQYLQVRIVKAIEDQEEECIKDLLRIRFVCSMKDD